LNIIYINKNNYYFFIYINIIITINKDIMLKHIKLNPIEKIVQIIYECDETILTKDLILELQKFIPTNDEVIKHLLNIT